MDRRFIAFEVQGDEADHRGRRQRGLLQTSRHQVDDFRRLRTPLAPDPEGECRRMQQQLVGTWFDRAVGHVDAGRLRSVCREARKPARIAGLDQQPDRRAGQYSRRNRFGGGRLCDCPPRRRLVDRMLRQIAGGGEGGPAAKDRRDPPRQPIGAPVPTQ